MFCHDILSSLPSTIMDPHVAIHLISRFPRRHCSKIEKLLRGVSSLIIFGSLLAPGIFPGVRFITPRFRWMLIFKVFYQGFFFHHCRSRRKHQGSLWQFIWSAKCELFMAPLALLTMSSLLRAQLEISTPSWMRHSLSVLLKSWPSTLQMSNHQLLLWATSSHLPFPGTMFNMCAFFFSVWLNHSLGAFSALLWYRLSRSFSQPELFSCLSSPRISATKVSYSLTWTLPALFLLELSQSWLERLDLPSGCPTWWIFYCPRFILPYQICHLHSQ